MVRELLQVNSAAVSSFWGEYGPTPVGALSADGIAGFIIMFVLIVFVIGCAICKMTGMAHQIQALEQRMDAAESFQSMQAKEDA